MVLKVFKMTFTSSLKQAVPVSVKHKIKDLMGIKDQDNSVKKAKPIEYWIDVVSGCNLRCTACPVGMPEFSNSIGESLREMDLELFEKICIKILCYFLFNYSVQSIFKHKND